MNDERFRKLEYEYRLLSENALECIWVYDIKSNRFTYMSPNVFKLRGVTAEEAMQESLADAVPGESYQVAMENTKRMVDLYLGGERREEMLSCVRDMQLYSKEKETKQIEVTVKLIENPETGALEVLGVSRDITERKALEAQLKQAIESKSEIIEQLKASETALKKLAEELNRKNKALSEIAVKDSLTGIFNRYYFDRKVVEESERSERYGYPLSMILFDIDDFKLINDTWGHDAGDRVLERIAGATASSIRREDIFARWGGEEFVVLLPNTDLPAAVTAAKKLKDRFETLSHPNINTRITASFGVTELVPGETKGSWFRRVDYAMFRSKNEGKNCVTGLDWTEAFPSVKINLEWKDEWESGNAVIDGRHREIIALGNATLDAMTDIESGDPEKAEKLLIEQIRLHFEEEEAILRAASYPEAEEHAAAHGVILARMDELHKQFLSGELKFTVLFSYLLNRIVIGHMLADDFRYFPYLKKGG